MTVPIPEVHMREVTVEIPDALVGIFSGNGKRRAAKGTFRGARDLSAVGVTAARAVNAMRPNFTAGDIRTSAFRARGAVAPAVRETSARVGSATTSVRRQATPLLRNASERGAELAGGARVAGASLSGRAREEWAPTARARLDETGATVGEAVRKGVLRAGQVAAVAGATGTVGAKAATAAGRRAAGNAASATGSFFSQLFSLLFWLSVVIWLLVRLFFPKPEQRERLYARLRQLPGVRDYL